MIDQQIKTAIGDNSEEIISREAVLDCLRTCIAISLKNLSPEERAAVLPKAEDNKKARPECWHKFKADMEALFDKVADDEAKARQYLNETESRDYLTAQDQAAYITETVKKMAADLPSVFKQAQSEVENIMKSALQFAEKNKRN